jgi:hypothetical protein
MRSPSICIIYPYFGKWPEWFDLFFETLIKNESIEFLFYTDCNIQGYKANNVKFVTTSFETYVEQASKTLNVKLNFSSSYKLCDLRPFLGKIHQNEIRNFDFYGFGDIDLLFGNIRDFYTNEILKKYDVLSTHENILSGHLCLFRNIKLNREFGKNIGGWVEKLISPYYIGMDESLLTVYQKWSIREDIGILSKIYRRFFGLKFYLKEQYTTPFTPIPWIDESVNSAQPNVWQYKNGYITNNRDGNRKFLYIHFMNFKSSKYRHDGSLAPWDKKDKICFATAQDMKDGIVINPEGIFPVKNQL